MAPLTSRVDPRSDAFRTNAAGYDALLARLRERMATAIRGGPDHLRDRHEARGKLLVRDRIDRLIDPDTPFLELSPLAAWGLYGGDVNSAGIVTGIATVAGQPIVIIANDATVKGGSFFHETVKKHIRAQEIAEQNRLPCLYLVDCGGAYLPEQDRVFPDRDHFGNTFHRQCRMSAMGLPQISVVFGGCTAGGAYIPALSDQVIMVDGNARIHLGGPSIVKVAIDEEVDGETLGGAAMHTRVSGVSDHLAADEPQALALARDIVGELNLHRTQPANRRASRPPLFDPDELTGVVSQDRRQPYDVREIVARLVDASEFQEFKPEWGETLVCGTARIHGYPVGILGNNGPLFSTASLKGAHFVTLCEQRGIPLLFLHNITGFMVGTEAERGGIAKHSAKMVYAMATTTVPKLSVIVGGSYGAGNYGMCGRGFRPHFLFAWPTAEVATMSADIASNVMLELRRTRHGAAPATDAELAAIEGKVRAQYAEQSDPYYATARLWDDGIIEPAQTRDVLGLCLEIVCGVPAEPPRRTPVFRM
ncbi:acetyl-CoA carboxylase subunit beta [Thalassobaculum fulvum]|uniref:Acetyl-CoA carboxylase subunit beta n=1 Tax=Thalassobaculum fulvum TaxID=1633335 RepID=A0A918XUQ9_9PROT|nr:carboxyl transferase domain-containing protein [Thalassobaculum fulvum]GHD57627.1 acetyl-CoA carboxylase subunit beta [Thalassobaculum fulvum]